MLTQWFGKFLLIGVISFSFSCDKREKERRPLNVTQKILKAKQGRFQSLLGDTITIESNSKLIFTKRYMSRQLIRNAPAVNNSPKIDYSNTFCSMTREYKVQIVSQLNLEDANNSYAHINFDKKLDLKLPVYIFQLEAGEAKASVFKDVDFQNESEADQNIKSICERDEPYFPFHSGDYFVQYPDENSMLIASLQPTIQELHFFEFSPRLYRSIESDNLNSNDFTTNFKSFEASYIYVRLNDEKFKEGQLSFSKENKTIVTKMSGDGQYNQNPSEKCEYQLTLLYDDFYKIKIGSLDDFIMKAKMEDVTFFSTLNFLKVKQFKFESLTTGPEAQECAKISELYKFVDSKPEEYKVAFHVSSNSLSLIVYSSKTSSVIFKAYIYQMTNATARR